MVSSVLVFVLSVMVVHAVRVDLARKPANTTLTTAVIKQKQAEEQPMSKHDSAPQKNLRDQIDSSSRIVIDVNDSHTSQNIVSRTQSIFHTHNKPLHASHENVQSAVKQGGGSKQNSVLSEYLFKENVRKDKSVSLPDYEDLSSQTSMDQLKSPAVTQVKGNLGRALDAKHEDMAQLNKKKRKEQAKAYLSSITTMFNPDILVGGSFIRGNEYHSKKGDQKQKVDADSEKEDGQAIPSENEKEPDVGSDGEFDFLKKSKSTRYFLEGNPTIKCRNCKQFGHMARECPNETKCRSCILCGKDTHESFDCNAKMCFKCNKVGHEARECTEKIVEKCPKCNHVGHSEARCLKEWDEPSRKMMGQMTCIQCGHKGHLKCTKEEHSKKIKIDTKVLNDLNEFVMETFRDAEISESEDESRRNTTNNPEIGDVDAFDYVNQNESKKKKKSKKLTKSQKRQRQMFMNDASGNVLMASSEEYNSEDEFNSDNSDYDSDDVTRRVFGNSGEERATTVYCAICAGKHAEKNCPNKAYSRSAQMNHVRDRFARETSFRQVGESYDRRNDNNYRRRDDYRHDNNSYQNRREDKHQRKQYTSWGNNVQKHSNIKPAESRHSGNGYKQQKRDSYHQERRNDNRERGYNHRTDLDCQYLSTSRQSSHNSNYRRSSQGRNY